MTAGPRIASAFYPSHCCGRSSRRYCAPRRTGRARPPARPLHVRSSAKLGRPRRRLRLVLTRAACRPCEAAVPTTRRAGPVQRSLRRGAHSTSHTPPDATASRWHAPRPRPPPPPPPPPQIEAGYSTPGDFILFHVYGCATEPAPDGKRRALLPPELAASPAVRFVPNEYPYGLEAGIEHHLIWCTQPLTEEMIDAVLAEHRPAAEWECAPHAPPRTVAPLQTALAAPRAPCAL